jgi:type I restriction enzyme M protein
MLSPQLRRKVNNLWSLFWSSGITNPLTAIEQITYLLFIKHLELLDAKRIEQNKSSIYAVPWVGNKIIKQDSEGKAIDLTPENCEQCRWSYIRDNADYDLLTDGVFPWLRVLADTLIRTGNNANAMLEAGRIMEDAYFLLPREKTTTLKTAINTIDELFTLEAHSDLMGDIFEELLRGIQSAGKNGQFRTPRHIIRFMVELVNPTPEDRIVDPAAGTGGFLFASIQHILKQAMIDEKRENDLRLEWDGTPHRLVVSDSNQWLNTEQFTGYDNDRTMVRIGWMNMILHGIENPRIERRDSLGKGLDDIESERYTVVLANPPFTGNIDSDDLHERRFFYLGGKKALTNKSELLYLALFLDLLEPPGRARPGAAGGRAAVIVPEGVLFGSTTAHRELRRRLLFEHDLKAVISLPAGVFQPYTGVKTSILYFHKHRANNDPKFAGGDTPYTQQVLFYEVLDDGYSLDAKRTEHHQSGDFPDALHKIEQRSTAADYVRPRTFIDRWRWVDKDTVELFPDLLEQVDHDYSISELFPGFREFVTPERASDLEAITNTVVAAQTLCIADAYASHLRAARATQATRKDLDKRLRQIRKAFTDAARKYLDNEDEQHARKAFDPALDSAHQQADAALRALLDEIVRPTPNPPTDIDLKDIAKAVTMEFAKLDGYTIWLRSLEAPPVPPEKHPYRSGERLEARSWLAPVRVLARNPDWQSTDGAVLDSHDEHAIVRPEYLAWLKDENKYNDDGSLAEPDLLEPACIEANNFNLSAGRYKPFALETTDYGDPKDLINQLQQREENILKGLEQLLAMVEGKA